MNSLDKLTQLFKEFPGIGPRQAKRFVYFLLAKNGGYTEELSREITELKKSVTYCPSCFRFFMKDNSPDGLCTICRSSREKKELMVVSTDIDFENIEKAHTFGGYYFILGGVVPILEKEPEKRVRSRELLAKVEKGVAAGLSEIIIATNYTPEGENTAEYVRGILTPLAEKHSLKISTLGRGLSTGTELEYSDSDTIKNALANRK